MFLRHGKPRRSGSQHAAFKQRLVEAVHECKVSSTCPQRRDFLPCGRDDRCTSAWERFGHFTTLESKTSRESSPIKCHQNWMSKDGMARNWSCKALRLPNLWLCCPSCNVPSAPPYSSNAPQCLGSALKQSRNVPTPEQSIRVELPSISSSDTSLSRHLHRSNLPSTCVKRVMTSPFGNEQARCAFEWESQWSCDV